MPDYDTQPIVEYYDEDFDWCMINDVNQVGAFLNEMDKVDMFTFDFEFNLSNGSIEIAQIGTIHCVYVIRFKQAIYLTLLINWTFTIYLLIQNGKNMGLA